MPYYSHLCLVLLSIFFFTLLLIFFFFFSSRRRHTRYIGDWSSDVCSSDLPGGGQRLSDFFRFFHGPNLRTLGLTAAMHARASAIRGGHTYPVVPPAQPKRYGLADALHLAAAIERSEERRVGKAGRYVWGEG